MSNPINLLLNQRPNNILGLVSMLKNGNPQQMFNQLMQTNPTFRDFVSSAQGKSPDDIARQYGVNPDILHQFMK